MFIIFIILVISASVSYLLWGDSISLETIRNHIDNFGIWAPIIFIVFYAVATIFIPSTPLMLLAGILFSFLNGLAYALIGGIISAIVLFLISRKLGASFVEKILQYKKMEIINSYNEEFSRGGVWTLIILRNMPIMPFNALNILMGISGIKTRNYIIGTAVGLIPTHLITIYAGNLLTKIF